MTGRERHAALEASIDADRARPVLPGGGGPSLFRRSPVRSWVRSVVSYGREWLALDLFPRDRGVSR